MILNKKVLAIILGAGAIGGGSIALYSYFNTTAPYKIPERFKKYQNIDEAKSKELEAFFNRGKDGDKSFVDI